jgi:hypothetical protein
VSHRGVVCLQCTKARFKSLFLREILNSELNYLSEKVYTLGKMTQEICEEEIARLKGIIN